MSPFQDISRQRSNRHTPAHRPPERAETRKPAPPPAPKAKSSAKSYAVTIALAVALGLLVQFQTLGVLAILAYAAASIIWRIPSRKTFLLALLALAAAAVASLVSVWVAARNFAVYSFLLMAAGTLSLCIEQARLSKLLHKKHQKLQAGAHNDNVEKPYKTVA